MLLHVTHGCFTTRLVPHASLKNGGTLKLRALLTRDPSMLGNGTDLLVKMCKATHTLALEAVLDVTEEGSLLGGDAESKGLNQT